MSGQFWASPGVEPKRAYRWLVRFNTNHDQLDEWLIKKVSPRPSWKLSESTHFFLNHTFYYPGRVEYDELSVTLVDAVTPNSARTLQTWLSQAGYVPPSEANRNFGTVSKAGFTAPGNVGLSQVEIEQLNETGHVLETWTLHNTWVKAVKYGDLDYESDDLLDIELTLRYDFFTLTQGSARGVAGSEFNPVGDVVNALNPGS